MSKREVLPIETILQRVQEWQRIRSSLEIKKEMLAETMAYSSPNLKEASTKNSKHRDSCFDYVEKIEEIENKIRQLSVWENEINILFLMLEDIDRIILEERYVKGTTWKAIGRKTGYNEAHCRNRAQKAMEELSRCPYLHTIVTSL